MNHEPHEPHEPLLYSSEVFQIQGAVFEVNREMGSGFLFNKIIVELKAARAIAPEHRAQVLNYLKATGRRLGLLVNFGASPKATIERLAR